tara:strand:- start:4902 stop:5090 length:189 start_codon:yes stop_codon:yes gene_type:complete
MNYPIYINYEAVYTNHNTTPRRYMVRAGSRDQDNLLDYHSKHHAVYCLREISYEDMDMNQTT